jgi:tRNA(Ile)-lysidine synthase
VPSISATIHQFFVKEGIQPERLAIAASGGTDSTALLLALSEIAKPVTAIHVNHHLRGADSDADEAFVRELCARIGIPLHVADGRLDPERVRARGIEAAAREVRYRQLQAMRENIGARFLVTAHQKNDQAETVLMRLLTSSGIAGLRGIHPVRDDGVIRPMLDITRAEIEAELRARNVVPRFDRSNDDPRFLRNRVRLLLRDLDVTDTLAAIAIAARAKWPVLERAIDEAERVCAIVDDDATRFVRWPDDAWLRGALLQRHIRRLDPEARDFDAERIADELNDIKRASITKHLELVRTGDGLVLRALREPAAAFEIALREDAPAFIPETGVTMHVARPNGTRRGQRIQLPANGVPAFVVRNRRHGDRFQPLGMQSPKKLKDFLIDRKIAAEVRDRLPLLVWNDEIVWIAGVEVSERFKVTDPSGVLYEVWTDEGNHPGLQR